MRLKRRCRPSRMSAHSAMKNASWQVSLWSSRTPRI
ncbi:hypothetical protein EVA_19724 [gut metagenome]|uniref:Uncharacterized protein n=1 Tax=gut metagenome TaxID=749906 RepID=J9FXU4_9ZZZZ